MTCYSSRYLGDKIYTYTQHEEYLLQKLVRKIERKYKLTSLGDLAPISGRGYFKSNGEAIRGSYWHDKWITNEECSKKRKIKWDCPCVYFELRYHPNNSNSYEHVTPDMVLDTLKEAAMITRDLPVMENLTHRSNAKYFRVIIPISYYNYQEKFTFENKKIPKQFHPYSKEYRLILDFLIMEYYQMFKSIYMVPNHTDQEMEFHLRYAGDWHFEYRNNIHRKIIQEVYEYCRKHEIHDNFLKNSHFIIAESME